MTSLLCFQSFSPRWVQLITSGPFRIILFWDPFKVNWFGTLITFTKSPRSGTAISVWLTNWEKVCIHQVVRILRTLLEFCLPHWIYLSVWERKHSNKWTPLCTLLLPSILNAVFSIPLHFSFTYVCIPNQYRIIILYFLTPHILLQLCVLLFSLGIAFMKCIHVDLCNIGSFIFMDVEYFTVWLYHDLFILLTNIWVTLPSSWSHMLLLQALLHGLPLCMQTYTQENGCWPIGYAHLLLTQTSPNLGDAPTCTPIPVAGY